jgi:subtilase family serine protease
MRKSLLLLAIALVAVVAAFRLSAGVGASGGTQRSGRPAETALRATAPVEATLVLRLPHRARLQRALRQASAAERGGDFEPISAAAFGARFGLGRRRLRSLRQVLARRHIRVLESYPQRTALRIEGSARAIDAAFHTTLRERTGRRGVRFHAPDVPPTLPPWLRGSVDAVAGLDTRPVAVAAAGSDGETSYSPAELANAYDYSGLQRAGVDGAARPVAIISFGSFRSSDLAQYEARFGIEGAPVRRNAVDGGPSNHDKEENLAEADLDIEMVRGVAPASPIVTFEAPNGRVSFGDLIDEVLKQGQAKIISDSFGACQFRYDDALERLDQRAFQVAVLAGVTIFAASGDHGAYDCWEPGYHDSRRGVDWPAASPDVVAVGGTHLSPGPEGGYGSERAWEDRTTKWGGGGGLAVGVLRPRWQAGPGVENSYSDGERQVPDVAADADLASGVDVVVGGGEYSIGGTSAAAPFWAGSASLIRDYLGRAAGGPKVGFLDPLLYAVAAEPRSRAFHDVTVGGNLFYRATPGWDYATGLGTPDVHLLAQALARRLGG